MSLLAWIALILLGLCVSLTIGGYLFFRPDNPNAEALFAFIMLPVAFMWVVDIVLWILAFVIPLLTRR